MRLKPTTGVWVSLAFCAALGLAALVLGSRGAGTKGTTAALFFTGRLSFLLFWPAYVGNAMAALFGTTFQSLRRHTREFGLAFASAHLVHIGLVAWLCRIGTTPSVSTFVFFGIAVFWTYLLALFSFDRLHQALNPKVWQLMRTVGSNYIMVAFAADFLKDPLADGTKHIIEYLPFAILVVVGPTLRLTAFMLRVAGRWANPSYRAS